MEIGFPVRLASRRNTAGQMKKKLKDTRSDPTQFSLQTLVDWALCISLATSKLRLKRKEKKKVEDLLFFFFIFSLFQSCRVLRSLIQKKKKKENLRIHNTSHCLLPFFLLFSIEICCENKGKSKRTGQIRWINSPSGCVVKCPATCFYAFGRTKLN